MLFIMLLCAAFLSQPLEAHSAIQKDLIETPNGPITIWFIGHGSLLFEYGGKAIAVDPWSKLTDYSRLPKADIILITHQHQDHLDTGAIAAISTPSTQIICNPAVYGILKRGTTMKNGDTLSVDNFHIEAVPAYNSTPGKEQFHPKGRDNGYVLTIGGKRIYIAGDTENIPEMTSLRNIDIAFLPMNQPYTMTPEQAAAAVKSFHPKILYPYHYGDTDVSKLTKLLAKTKGTEIRIRPMK